MSDDNQTSAGTITSIELVAVRIVFDAPEAAHATDGSEDLAGVRLMKTVHPPEIIVSEGEARSIGPYQIAPPMDKPAAAWAGELKAPGEREALSSLTHRDRGGLRVGLLTGLLVTSMLGGAVGLGWWSGLLAPRQNLDAVSTPPQQTAAVDRAVPDADKPINSEPAATQVVAPAETATSAPVEGSGTEIDGASAPHGDRGVVTSTDSAPTTAQKIAATKPAVTPQKTQERHARSRPKPVPETRPTTIAGWTVRSISGGKAVLQGPGGIREVAVGETVPGAGRIDSIVRWGNRWIVATSRGLISTD